MQRGQHVDQTLARDAANRGRERGGLLSRVEHMPFDVTHDVERRSVHILVFAEPERGRDRNRCRTQGGDDAVLARAMSCAVASTSPIGGRRNTKTEPSAPVTLYVRFERPPAISSKSNGASAPAMLSTNHRLTGSISIPRIPATVTACRPGPGQPSRIPLAPMLDEARPIVLTPTSYLVLGLIAGRDRVTSYELKQFVAVSIGYFWPFPHSQLYAEPARLVAVGLLAEDIETAGRKRRYYAITDAGRTALTSWLEQPTENRTEIRDLGLLKLFFASHASTSDRLRLAQDQLAAHEEMLKEYEECTPTSPRSPILGNYTRSRWVCGSNGWRFSSGASSTGRSTEKLRTSGTNQVAAVDRRDLDEVAGVGRVDHLAATDVHAFVVDEAAKEHKIAGLKVLDVHVRQRVPLRQGVMRETGTPGAAPTPRL